jgi:hypothetical protein
LRFFVVFFCPSKNFFPPLFFSVKLTLHFQPPDHCGQFMRKFFYFFLILVLFSGCAPAHLNKTFPSNISVPSGKRADTGAPAAKPPALDGVIFGKADFRGVLKVEYVKLMIVDENNPDKTYELFFGDRTGETTSLVEPHYFFLELPASKYRITSISIPVGTTLATEKTDIAFDVEKESLIYLGTLRVTGTDQKIRFGAIPIIRPGFDYKVDILNEQDEAVRVFRSRYPKIQRDIQVKLMQNLRIQVY